MSLRVIVRTAITTAMIAFACAVPRAIERGPLPSIALVGQDGHATKSDQFVQPGNWLVVSVAPACQPCDTILASIDAMDHPALSSHLIVIVDATDASTLPARVARYPHLSGATWLADPSSALRQWLGVNNAVSILGLHGRMVEWTVSGALTDARDVKSMLASWIQQP